MYDESLANKSNFNTKPETYSEKNIKDSYQTLAIKKSKKKEDKTNSDYNTYEMIHQQGFQDKPNKKKSYSQYKNQENIDLHTKKSKSKNLNNQNSGQDFTRLREHEKYNTIGYQDISKENHFYEQASKTTNIT